MPFIWIYKMPDGYWHTNYHSKFGETFCGKPLNEFIESKTIGGDKGKDPSVKEICLECFHFIGESKINEEKLRRLYLKQGYENISFTVAPDCAKSKECATKEVLDSLEEFAKGKTKPSNGIIL